MDEDGALFDSGFDDNEPFRVTPEAGGISLESALRDFGPAAIDDLIPRIRALATSLDAAHSKGVVHGALHPSKVIVTDDHTSLLKGGRSALPYVAPELIEGERATPASDQFALAAITYEWMFGRPIAGPAERPVEVRTMPGVNRVAAAKAFTRALAPKANQRFASCTDFCVALASSVTPELPLLALDLDDDDPLGPLHPESALDAGIDDAPLIATPNDDHEDVPFDSDRGDSLLAQGRPFDSDGGDSLLAQGRPFDSDREDTLVGQSKQPDFDTLEPQLSRFEPVPVPSWNPASAERPPVSHDSRQRFGAFALILATIVGAVFGFAAGYMARPRALQSGPVASIARPAGTENDLAPAKGSAAITGPETPAPVAARAPETPKASPSARPESAASGRESGPASEVRSIGRLLVRSTPSGASVSVDGVAKGVTPVALRDLAVGTRNVILARRGYIPETRTVSLTTARPSRSLDVRLSPEASAPRPATPATSGKPAVSIGALAVDSRPSGAAVSLNGKPSGTTPLVLSDLAPGEYRILMRMPGYREFTTTVRVVAGERARAAASLTAQEQE